MSLEEHVRCTCTCTCKIDQSQETEVCTCKTSTSPEAQQLARHRENCSHYVSLVNGRDPLPVVSRGIVEGILSNSMGFFLGDHLEPLHHTRDTLMLQSTVLPLRVLTDHHYVNISVPGVRGCRVRRCRMRGCRVRGCRVRGCRVRGWRMRRCG